MKSYFLSRSAFVLHWTAIIFIMLTARSLSLPRNPFYRHCPEQLADSAHRQHVFVLPASNDTPSLAPFVLESQALVEANGSRV